MLEKRRDRPCDTHDMSGVHRKGDGKSLHDVVRTERTVDPS